LQFDPDSVLGERIAEEAEYEGVRVRFRGNLGTARVSMQIDVGFGDAVVPGPVTADYPTMLDLPAPRVRAYTRESVIAEKFHAMVHRGLLNSRMKDFYDVWALSRQFDFDGGVLAAAIRETFARRDLGVVPRPVALTDEFAADTSKVAQWRGFLRKSRLQGAPSELAEVIGAITVFLGPVAEALYEGREFTCCWVAPGPWTTGRTRAV
jgi:hypothetical protein